MSAPSSTPEASADAVVAATVRSSDFDRYAATLFAPAAARPHLLALYVFDVELARIRDLVREPMPGEIRLQWWRDALADPGRSDAAAHPVARALEAAIRHGRLPREALAGLVDARADDLYDDPLPSIEDLERRLGATASVVLRLASLILAGGSDPGGVDAAGHGGVAQGMARLLRALPRQAARGQLLLPTDRMAAHGLQRDSVIAGRKSQALAAVLAEMRALGRTHLAKARRAYPSLDPVAAPAFLPLARLTEDFHRLETTAETPFVAAPERARWARLWRLRNASLRTPPF